MNEFDVLIGERIKSVELSADKDYLVFKAAIEDFIFYADGDCCSSSCFESLDGLDRLIGHKIISVDEINMDRIPWPEGVDGDEEKIYGWKLMTEKGYVDITMRNSSNGYYGGSLMTVSHISSDIKFNTVTEDF